MGHNAVVDPRRAEELLSESDSVVSLATGSMSYIKELVERCLAADIPALPARPPGKGPS